MSCLRASVTPRSASVRACPMTAVRIVPTPPARSIKAKISKAPRWLANRSCERRRRVDKVPHSRSVAVGGGEQSRVRRARQRVGGPPGGESKTGHGQSNLWNDGVFKDTAQAGECQ